MFFQVYYLLGKLFARNTHNPKISHTPNISRNIPDKGNRKVAEFSRLNVAKSWEFFQEEITGQEIKQKTLNSSEQHPSQLSGSHRIKDTSTWKSEKNYTPPVKTTRLKIETKERKKKRELWIQTPYWYFRKKNCIVQLFFVSIQRRVSSFDLPILSFYFIFFVLNQMLCF